MDKSMDKVIGKVMGRDQGAEPGMEMDQGTIMGKAFSDWATIMETVAKTSTCKA